VAGLNLFQCIGNIGNIDIRYTAKDDPVANFSVGINSTWKDKAGEKQQRTDWANCVAFRKQAEIAEQYLEKGMQVYVQGEMRTEEYEKDGEKKYSTKVYVNRFQILGKKNDNGSQGQQSKASRPASKTGSGFDDMDDDIPF
jgi:single-strand DNA-binding protein